MPMAQAWHKQREQLELVGEPEIRHWRASNYRVNNRDNREVVEAAPDAKWKLSTPFDSYRPTSMARELDAGPHLTFLNLKRLLKEKRDLFHKALVLFANKYGLLGAFEGDYDLRRPLVPPLRSYIAPEAVVDEQGRLRRVDPATEGRELLLDLIESGKVYYPYNTPRQETYSNIATPSEIEFNAKHPNLDSEWRSIEPPRQLVPWETIKKDFGALVVLDEQAWKGVSILCTRESINRWTLHLLFFPSDDTPVDYLVSDDGGMSFNSYLQEVSPRVVIGKDGNLQRGWRCRSLLQAMYVMLYLDLTGGNTIRKCQSRGCSNYFRVGSQGKSRYCSQRCANRASTRMRRGQEP